MTLERRLERLEAWQAVNRLIADLARAFDAGPSAVMLASLFTENAVFVIDQYGNLTGRQAIAEGVAGNATTGFRWTLHYLVSPVIEIDDSATRAAVDFMLWEVATAASARDYLIGGRYLADAVLDAGRWRFARLELRADLISQYAPGWTSKPRSLAEA